MTTVTIPKQLTKKGDLVVIPRQEYEEFLSLQKMMKMRREEETDTDTAIKLYKREKRSRKLRTIRSLADLD